MARAYPGEKAAMIIKKVDYNVFRGPSPKTIQDFSQLEKLGVKTILNLQRFDDAQELIWSYPRGITVLNLDLRSVFLQRRAVDQAVYFLFQEKLYPIYVHCRHGRERTGLVVALYRRRKYGFSFSKAFNEMIANGCRWPFSWIYRAWLKRG